MNLRHLTCCLLFAATLFCGLPCAHAASSDKEYDQAEQLRNSRKYDDALNAYQALLGKPNRTTEQKVRYLWGMVDCKRQQKKYPEALVLVDQIIATLPPKDFGLRPANDARFDLLGQVGKAEDSALYATQLAGLAGEDDIDSAISWYQRSAMRWMSIKRYPEALQQAQLAATAARSALMYRRVADSLWISSDAMWSASYFEKCIPPLQQILEIKSNDITPDYILRTRTRLSDCFLKLNRFNDARAAYQSYIDSETDANIRQRWWMAIARTWQTEKNLPAAIKAMEQVILAQPGISGHDYWYEAQSNIADLLGQTGDLSAAMQAAQICFAIADTRERVTASGNRIAGLLQQMDKKNTRAKAFTLYQREGGKDGVSNPLDALPFAPQAEVARIFTEAQTHLGTDPAALIQRGLMHAYLGQKKEACAILLEACRRAAGDDVLPACNALLFVGVRGLRGNVADLDHFAQFLAYGPTGPEGKSTLADPFLELNLPPAAIAISPDSLATFRELRKRLEQIVDDYSWTEGGRRDAVVALQRVHEALGDWNDKSVLDWYITHMETDRDARAQDLLFSGIMSAARQGQYHWGSSRQYLSSLDNLPPKLQKRMDPANKGRQSPFYNIDKLEEQTRASLIFRK